MKVIRAWQDEQVCKYGTVQHADGSYRITWDDPREGTPLMTYTFPGKSPTKARAMSIELADRGQP